MRVTVDKLAWIGKGDLSLTQLQALRQELLIRPVKVGDYPGDPPEPIKLWQETETHIGIPREFFLERRKERHEIELSYTMGGSLPSRMEFSGTLRTEQQGALDQLLGVFSDPYCTGGLVRAAPGWGKTVFCCAAIAKLNVPTLVIVHKEFLMNQWRERIQQFLPNAAIGQIQQDVCDIEGKHIVMAMVHSLAAKPYPPATYQRFGLLITDESLGYGSKVLTTSGYREIGKLVESPEPVEVLAWDNSTKTLVPKSVTKKWVHPPRSSMLRVEHEHGSFECTANHVVLTPLGDVRAGDLYPGDYVIHYSGDEPEKFVRLSDASRDLAPSRVLRVVPVDTPELVYDLSVVDLHNFVVDGVVVHNCHRIGAETWSPVPAMFPARWRLGVSATPHRKDGADNVFKYHLGRIIYSSFEQRMKVKVKRVWSDFKLVHTPSFNPNLAPRTLILKFLVASKQRNERIAQQIVAAVAVGRKLLVLSERLTHLDALHALVRERWVAEFPDRDQPTAGFYVGGRSEEEYREASGAQIIFATKQYASEGLDIPALDTLILTTPMGDVEQAVGRIQRPFPGKKEPIVVDIRDDNVKPFYVSGKNRDRFYLRVTE